MKRRILKALGYRLIATVGVQAVIWIAFQKVEINALMLTTEPIRVIVYILYDWLWNKYSNR